LDEFEIEKLLKKGARIDAFGVGTAVGTSADAPNLDIVYKLVRYDKRNIRKFSPGKQTLAGEKQVFRKQDARGKLSEDIVGLRHETVPEAKPLLSLVMRRGELVGKQPSLREIQNNFRSNLNALGNRYKSIYESHRFPVHLSEKLEQIQGDI